MESPVTAGRDYKWALLLLAGLAGLAGVYIDRLGDDLSAQSAPGPAIANRRPPVARYAGWTPSDPDRFPRVRHHDAAITTTEVDALTSRGDELEEIKAPIGKPVRFDRRTESPSIVYLWRSEDGTSAEAEATVSFLEDAATAMKEYLRPDDTESKPMLYSMECSDCGDDRAPHDRARGVAGRHSINIQTTKQELREVAVHELAHFYTPGVARCYERPALCEGLAVFMEAALAGRLGHVHSEAARVASLADGMDLFEMDGAGFYRLSDLGGRYMLGGSFVGYLIERYGIDPVRSAVSGSPFRDAFRTTRVQLEADWRQFLRGDDKGLLPLPPLYPKPYIVVYGRDFCGNCQDMRRRLDERDIPYVWKNIDEEPGRTEAYSRMRKTGLGGKEFTLPFVDVNAEILVHPEPSTVIAKYHRASPPIY